MLTIPSLKFLPVGNHPQPLAGGAAAGGAVKMDVVLAGPSHHRDVNTDILCPGPVATCPASPRLPAAAENCLPMARWMVVGYKVIQCLVLWTRAGGGLIIGILL